MSTLDTNQRIDTALEFLRVVFKPDDWIELRLLPMGARRWFRLADEPAAAAALRWAAERNAREHDPDNVYFGVHPRIASGKSGDTAVAEFRMVIADWDGVDPAEAVQRCRDKNLPEPSIVIASGGGTHGYFMLEEPIADAAQYRGIVRAIAADAGSDKSVHNPERLLRVPGFDNVKPTRPVGRYVASSRSWKRGIR